MNNEGEIVPDLCALCGCEKLCSRGACEISKSPSLRHPEQDPRIPIKIRLKRRLADETPKLLHDLSPAHNPLNRDDINQFLGGSGSDLCDTTIKD
jgi:hypothetical protein